MSDPTVGQPPTPDLDDVKKGKNVLSDEIAERLDISAKSPHPYFIPASECPGFIQHLNTAWEILMGVEVYPDDPEATIEAARTVLALTREELEAAEALLQDAE